MRACQFAHGERMFLSVQDNTFSQTPTIFIYNLAEDLKDRQCDKEKGKEREGFGVTAVGEWMLTFRLLLVSFVVDFVRNC